MQRGLNPLDDKIFMWSTSSTSERKSVSESLFSGSILLFSTGVAIVGGRLRTSMSKKLRKRWEIIERHWIEKTFQGFLILHGKTKTNVCQSVTRVLVKRGIWWGKGGFVTETPSSHFYNYDKNLKVLGNPARTLPFSFFLSFYNKMLHIYYMLLVKNNCEIIHAAFNTR